jgi:DivIVA domain-containing protein
LERQSIERKDFPIGRRGYDPDAVDAHLRGLADEIEELKRSARRRSETLASTASEQVRTIVEAAENSAAEIERQAEEEAREIRAEATNEAQATREHASAQARDYVGKVSESTAAMLQRVDAMESELNALIESLRTGGNRLNADLQLLASNFDAVRQAVSPRMPFEPEPGLTRDSLGAPGAGAPAAGVESIPPAGPEGPHEIERLGGTAAPDYEQPAAGPASAASGTPASAAPGTPAAGAPGNGSDDTEGARLIALNMALNGTPREETDRYLAENFRLSDRAALLDEVYTSVES